MYRVSAYIPCDYAFSLTRQTQVVGSALALGRVMGPGYKLIQTTRVPSTGPFVGNALCCDKTHLLAGCRACNSRRFLRFLLPLFH